MATDREFITSIRDQCNVHLSTVTVPPVDPPPVEPPVEPPVTGGQVRPMGPLYTPQREFFEQNVIYTYALTAPYGATSFTTNPETQIPPVGGLGLELVISDIPGSLVVKGPLYGHVDGVESGGIGWSTTPTPSYNPRAVITGDKPWYMMVCLRGGSSSLDRKWQNT